MHEKEAEDIWANELQHTSTSPPSPSSSCHAYVDVRTAFFPYESCVSDFICPTQECADLDISDVRT